MLTLVRTTDNDANIEDNDVDACKITLPTKYTLITVSSMKGMDLEKKMRT